MKKTISQTNYQDFKLHYHKRDRAIGGLISRSGEYEPFEKKLLLECLRPGDIVIDAGANIGVYTLPIAKAVGPQGKVYAFEPSAENRSLLVQNLSSNHVDNAIISPVALAQKKETMMLYLSHSNMGDHRLFPEENGRRHFVTIQADSLDNELEGVFRERHPVNLIKSDTQGFEPFVIEGAREIIRKYEPVIFIEYWPWGFIRSGGNRRRMLRFLLSVYRNMYFIDEKRRKLFETDRAFIEEYCLGHRGYLHCNLVFFPDRTLARIRRYEEHYNSDRRRL